MIQMSKLLALLFLAVSTPPAIADDGFTPIHQNNQKIGSAVSQFWARLGAQPALAPADGFMAIYMANQKVGSPTANFWMLQAKSDCPTATAAAASP